MSKIFDKNYQRQAPTFANINLLGRCNINCFFCLGKDLPEHFNKNDYTNVHFNEWENLDKFLVFCQENDIQNLYITGQNTDSLLYHYLRELIVFLQELGFKVGVRTNGYGAIGHLDTLNMCKNSVGYSIISLDHNINHKICGVYEIPDWKYIIPRTKNCRISLVINRYNFVELMEIIKFVSQFENVKYLQLRRVSTDTRSEELKLDVEIFEHVYEACKQSFAHQFKDTFYGSEVMELYGKPVSFWRTVKTSISSFNYYTDGVFTDEYFVIEGYLNALRKIGGK